ncbi:MAG TPA: ABC transporter ATP-binding protein [Acidimicrobiales bacterium]|nr:ABC transporter ATP-binding protein [Acidimicrobiales bacterium]
MASVELEDVVKSFGRAPVLDGVDLVVDDGTTLSLLGPSGSGKSTLLRIIAGLEQPDRGRVRLSGADVTGTPVHRRGVGVVFQDQALFPHLDVGGNVGFGLRMAGVGGSERRRRVADALELVGLPGYEGRDPATLSGGEAQRVALARALAPEPGVVLLDEPLAALDQLLRERLLVELRSLFDELAVTVVAVTHDPTEAAALGDRIAVLLDGRIAQTGTAGEVIAAPASASVAGLVGQRNVLDGWVVEGGVETALGLLRADVRDRAGDVAVLVPPAAVVPDAGGLLRGTVRGLLYRSGTPVAVVADVALVDGSATGPTLDVLAEPGWRVGEDVRLRIDESAIHLMAR